MYFLTSYVCKLLPYDLINTFYYQNLKQVPKLKEIILNFGYKRTNFKHIVSGLLALEFISHQKSKLTKSKNVCVFLKIKKGNPVGCKVVLKKKIMDLFYSELIITIFPKIKHFKTIQYQQNFRTTKSISLKLKNPLIFEMLENQYQFFKNVPNLNITLLTNSKSRNELIFLLKSTKFFV